LPTIILVSTTLTSVIGHLIVNIAPRVYNLRHMRITPETKLVETLEEPSFDIETIIGKYVIEVFFAFCDQDGFEQLGIYKFAFGSNEAGFANLVNQEMQRKVNSYRGLYSLTLTRFKVSERRIEPENQTSLALFHTQKFIGLARPRFFDDFN